MGKSSSDEGAKAAKAGLCACGICCALCIGIPLLIIIIIIIIVAVVTGKAASDVADALRNCNVTESSTCVTSFDCNGDRNCVDSVCTGTANC